jgi:hypothetical protein
MSSGVPINSSRRTITLPAGALNDADGLVESLATSATAVELDASDFDGALVTTDGTLWAHGVARTVTVTLSSSAGSYNDEDPIVVTGKRGGTIVTEEFLPPTANGNVTLRGSQAFDRVTSIAIPAQVDTSGAFTFGAGDLCAPAGDSFHALTVRDEAGGQLNVQYGEGEDAPTDSFPVSGFALEPCAPTRVLTDPGLSAPTTVALTLHMG